MTEVELEYKPLDLDNLRSALIRQEESILFAIIERAQFKQNSVIYTPGGAFNFGNSFTGSFFQFCLFETECTHAKLRRYTSPDEHAFFPVDQLPSPALPVYKYPTSIVENNININQEILDIYLSSIVPMICKAGDDGNYGSSGTHDVQILQAVSKRIHYGKFVAEVKYAANPEKYKNAILAKDPDAIWSLITDKVVEEKVLDRVSLKAKTYGRDPTISSSDGDQNYFIDPAYIREIYENIIIPMTKKVQVKYLLNRLG